MKKIACVVSVIAVFAMYLAGSKSYDDSLVSNNLFVENVEALSRTEITEEACVAGGDGCVFHGLFIADSHNY